MTKLWRDEEWLRRQYIDEELSIWQIAQLAGCCTATIKNHLRWRGIRRSATGQDGETSTKLWQDEGWLRENYVEHKLSAVQMARLAGCTEVTIANWLKRYGIPRRSLREAREVRQTHHEERAHALRVARLCKGQ